MTSSKYSVKWEICASNRDHSELISNYSSDICTRDANIPEVLLPEHQFTCFCYNYLPAYPYIGL